MYGHKNLVQCCVLTLSLVSVFHVLALEAEDAMEMSLEESLNIEITSASRSARGVKDLPATVHIITREQILNNNYSTLVDAFKDILGVKVSQPGNGTHGEKYLMRGLWGNNYAKIPINGIPVRPSAVDGTPIGEQINMENMERIGVVYGPASALYGAHALAGIFNMITYNPGENVTRLRASVGSFGYVGTKFFVNNSSNGVRLTTCGGYSEYRCQSTGCGQIQSLSQWKLCA